MPRPPKPITIDTSVHEGNLELSVAVRKQLGAALRLWGSRPVVLEIRPWEETRRAKANRFLWGVVYKLMAEEMGVSKDDIHEIEKLRHNSKVVSDPATGDEVKIAQSTAKLTIEQFSDYMSAVMLDGSEHLGIVFPEPRKSEDWRERRAA